MKAALMIYNSVDYERVLREYNVLTEPDYEQPGTPEFDRAVSLDEALTLWEDRPR